MSLRDPPATGPDVLDATAGETRAGAGPGQVLCAACDHHIARRDDAITVDGRHEHTFTNPHGYVHTVRLFARAPGCRLLGEPTLEATWFAGHAWRIAVCAGCGEALGWHWRAGGGAGFHGLIRHRVREAD